MMKNIVRLLIICIILFNISFSCKKHRAKKLSGTYECEVNYVYYDGAPTHIDSSYYETVEVKQDKRHIEVLGLKIHIDSIWDGQVYRRNGGGRNYKTISISDNKIDYYSEGGGQGGGYRITYNCIKSK